jgi:hypothetical protein
LDGDIIFLDKLGVEDSSSSSPIFVLDCKYKRLRRLLILKFGYRGCRKTLTVRFYPVGGTIMPKLNNRPPKYCKLKKYAVVYLRGKIHYLGLYNSPESRTAYNRLIAETRDGPTIDPPKGEPGISVKEGSELFDNSYAKAVLSGGEQAARAQLRNCVMEVAANGEIIRRAG